MHVVDLNESLPDSDPDCAGGRHIQADVGDIIAIFRVQGMNGRLDSPGQTLPQPIFLEALGEVVHGHWSKDERDVALLDQDWHQSLAARTWQRRGGLVMTMLFDSLRIE